MEDNKKPIRLDFADRQNLADIIRGYQEFGVSDNVDSVVDQIINYLNEIK